MGREMETRTERERGVMQSCRQAGHGAVSLRGLGLLARGVDVQLALEDVVNDRLAEVIHNVSIPVLQGQSGGMGREKGVRAHWGESGAPTNGEAGWGHPAP